MNLRPLGYEGKSATQAIQVQTSNPNETIEKQLLSLFRFAYLFLGSTDRKRTNSFGTPPVEGVSPYNGLAKRSGANQTTDNLHAVWGVTFPYSLLRRRRGFPGQPFPCRQPNRKTRATNNHFGLKPQPFFRQPDGNVHCDRDREERDCPGGTMTFKKGTIILGTAAVANGQAKFATAFTKAGTFSIVASYSGDQSYRPQISKAIKQVVK